METIQVGSRLTSSQIPRWYRRWVGGHIAAGMVLGGIMEPAMSLLNRYEDKLIGNSVQSSAIYQGAGLGAFTGAILGIPGPLSYLAIGGYYLWNQK